MNNLLQDHKHDKEKKPPRKLFKADLNQNSSSFTKTDAAAVSMELHQPDPQKVDVTGSVEVESLETINSRILPEEILRIIYKCVLDLKRNNQEKANDDDDDYAKHDFSTSTTKTLLDCRLVNSDWKNAVDNYKLFMGELNCTVSSIPVFVNSTICTKVKILRFVDALSTDLADQEDQLDRFFNEIIPNVNNLVFDFPTVDKELLYKEVSVAKEEQRLLFSNLIKSAKQLKQIRIMSPNRKFLRTLSPDEIELVGSNVKDLCVNIEDLVESEIPVLREFLLSLPNLSNLFMFHQNTDFENDEKCLSDNKVLELVTKEVIVPHIQVFPGSLKGISFNFDVHALGGYPHIMNSLMIAVINRNLQIAFGDQVFGICDIFQQIEGEGEVNEIRCMAIKNGMVDFEDYPTDTLQKVRFCTKMEQLEIIFENAGCENNELDFLPKLKSLKCLTFDSFRSDITIIAFPDLVFLPGIPSLETLILNVNICESYANFPMYFPNLQKLCLQTITRNIPVEILRSFGQMGNLKELEISECKVTDEMFTQPCEVGGEIIPVIAIFKNLKALFSVSV